MGESSGELVVRTDDDDHRCGSRLDPLEKLVDGAGSIGGPGLHDEGVGVGEIQVLGPRQLQAARRRDRLVEDPRHGGAAVERSERGHDPIDRTANLVDVRSDEGRLDIIGAHDEDPEPAREKSAESVQSVLFILSPSDSTVMTVVTIV